MTNTIFSSWRLLTGPGGSIRRKRHTLGAILGIAFSLVPLITVQHVASGMIEGISRRFLEIGTFHLQVRPYLDEIEFDMEESASSLEKHPSTEIAIPQIEGIGIAYSPHGRTGVSIRALPSDWLDRDRGADTYLEWLAGSYDLEEADSVLVSKEAAVKMEVGLGDQITILTAYKVGDRGTVMKPSRFTVRGVFSTGYYELDALTLYIPFERGKSLFKEPWSRSIGIKVEDPYEGLGAVKERLQESFDVGWRVYTWYDMHRPMFESFKTTKNLLVFIMVLIVIVASVSITSAIVMMVLEHEAEIAMLKSTGVATRVIERIYLGAGMFIGIAGTLLGTVLGLMICLHINDIIQGIELMLGFFSGAGIGSDGSLTLFNSDYYLETIPVSIGFKDLFFSAFFALFFSFLGSWLPARRAGRLKPLDILRRH
jgi:lipoprotein-releasing system permease protein